MLINKKQIKVYSFLYCLRTVGRDRVIYTRCWANDDSGVIKLNALNGDTWQGMIWAASIAGTTQVTDRMVPWQECMYIQ